MKKFNLVSLWIILILIKSAKFQRRCPETILTFELSNGTTTSDTWFGKLHLKSNVVLHGIFVDLIFDRRADTVGTYFYTTTTADNVEYRIEDKAVKLRPNENIDIRFYVKFNPSARAPMIQEIRLNGQNICSDTRTAGQFTSVNVNPTSTVSSNNRRDYVPSNNNDDESTYRNPYNTRAPEVELSTRHSPDSEDDYRSSTRRNQRTTVRPQNNRNPSVSTDSSNNRRDSVPLKNNDDENDFRSSTRHNQGTTVRPQNNRNPSVSNANTQTHNNQNSDTNLYQLVDHTTRRTTITRQPDRYNTRETQTTATEGKRHVSPTSQPSYFQGDLSYNRNKNDGNNFNSNSRTERNPLEDDTCGTVIANVNALIISGEVSYAGQFPWHAALYISTGSELKYICGGSLISKTAILTAAHCVTIERSTTPINSDSLLIYMGKFNLKKWTGPEEDVKVSEIIVNPQFNYDRFYSDVAIIKLKSEVTITDYIRPVCLWNTNTDIRNIVNNTGTVPGWGYNEYGVVSDELSFIKMPVVSHETCIWSNREFFSRVTSNMSFCAGFKNGSSVCNGDSGGAMVFQRNNKWHLRGIVSVSIALQNQARCDPNHYAVFTDVAKFTSWIENNTKK